MWLLPYSNALKIYQRYRRLLMVFWEAVVMTEVATKIVMIVVAATSKTNL